MDSYASIVDKVMPAVVTVRSERRVRTTQMPQMDGFGVLRELTPHRIPLTIFVTAYDKYAIQALEAHALDYLLKPYSDERFEATLQRARDQIPAQEAGELSVRLARLLEKPVGPAEGSGYLERIAIKSAGRALLSAIRRHSSARVRAVASEARTMQNVQSPRSAGKLSA